jgi:muramoyltetrapeptide carboxypeptidase
MKETDKTVDAAVSPAPLWPPSMRHGDTIGIVAPAGSLKGRQDDIDGGIAILKEMGFQVQFRRDLTSDHIYLAGSDRQRLSRFHEVWSNSEVKAVMAVRGGFGCLRIAPDLDMEMIKERPKPFIGFSDNTVLSTAILKATGMITFHGPMVVTLPRSDQETLDSFYNWLTGNYPPFLDAMDLDLQIVQPGQATGRLVGGNLTTLSHLIATPFEMDWDNRILFIEDVGELPYKLDRMLTHFKLAGKLNNLAGVILGTFGEDVTYSLTVEQRLLEILDNKNIPVWSNFPTGHESRNMILPIGAKVTMDSNSGKLLFHDLPVSAE